MTEPQHDKKWLKRMRAMSGELNSLPVEWQADAAPSQEEEDNWRFWYIPPPPDKDEEKKELTWIHPTLGPLPDPWILRLCSSPIENFRVPRYFNTDTKMTTTKDPRYSEAALLQRAKTFEHHDMSIMANVVSSAAAKKGKSWSLDKMIRQEVSAESTRHSYDILKVLDRGDGSLGAMNGGVFVVRLKGQTGVQKLNVEKRFKTHFHLAEQEITIMREMKHGSLAMFHSACFNLGQELASLYIEFCDRGSLETLIENYQQKRIDARNNGKTLPKVPERFIWHAFAGLADGLAYLNGGRTYIPTNVTDYSVKPGWKAVLHCDIKPDNVLLRSRDTADSKKYYYCVLSDFGLAHEYNPKRPRGVCGTGAWMAPELIWSPAPKTEEQMQTWANEGQRGHTPQSELWALGACIYSLATCDAWDERWKKWQISSMSHITYQHWAKVKGPAGMDTEDFYMYARISRKPKLDIGTKVYSQQLQSMILQCTAPAQKRVGPIAAVKEMKTAMKKAGFMGAEPERKDEALPSWATRHHSYHSNSVIPDTFDHRKQ